jgi:hypothetical protein
MAHYASELATDGLNALAVQINLRMTWKRIPRIYNIQVILSLSLHPNKHFLEEDKNIKLFSSLGLV